MPRTGNKDNLTPLNRRTIEEQREIQRMGGRKSGEARREKKLLSQLYGELLAADFEIDGEPMSLKEVVSSVLARKDSSSVSMLKEIREATEGSKVEVSEKVITVGIPEKPDDADQL